MARFPFSAIVGQDEMKQALLIAAIDPSIGGVMVFGDRGTGKSTAARALADYEEDAEQIARKAMAVAADICVFTNGNLTLETV